MSVGKYSPTVSKSYDENQNWFAKYSKGEMFDPDGYDRYGYDKNDTDRAGVKEDDYLIDVGLWDKVKNEWDSKPVICG